jgi:hypothetical protein
MLPACFCGLISVLNEQAARSTMLTEKLVTVEEYDTGSAGEEVEKMGKLPTTWGGVKI